MDTETPDAAPRGVLLTANDIKSWLAERERLRAESKAIDDKLRAIERKLEAAELLTGQSLLERNEHEGDEEETGSMAEAAALILKRWRGLISNKQMKLELSKSPEFKKRLDASANYYYTMMARLVKQGKAEKVGTRYRAPAANTESASHVD